MTVAWVDPDGRHLMLVEVNGMEEVRPCSTVHLENRFGTDARPLVEFEPELRRGEHLIRTIDGQVSIVS